MAINDTGPIEAICRAFEDAWFTEGPPRLDDYLQKLPSEAASDLTRRLLAELVGVDLEQRWRRAARQSAIDEGTENQTNMPGAAAGAIDLLPARPRLADYVARYPELGPLRDLPAEAIINEYYALCRWDVPPDHDEFLATYREEDVELREGLGQIDEELGAAQRDVLPARAGRSSNSDEVDEEPRLVERAIAGDRQAVKLVLFRSRDRVLRHIERRIPPDLVQTIRAEVILQATHIQVFRSIHAFEMKSDFSLRNWLEAIADNLLMDAIHTAYQRTRQPQPDDVAMTDSTSSRWP